MKSLMLQTLMNNFFSLSKVVLSLPIRHYFHLLLVYYLDIHKSIRYCSKQKQVYQLILIYFIQLNFVHIFIIQQKLFMQKPSENSQPQSNIFSIFHFNDVYDIQPSSKQPRAGAAHFKALLDRYKAQYKTYLTLFSGDVFSPSLISTQFEGENMIKPLNSFGIDLACFGNHDLDYSLQHVKHLIGMTNFPWLLSNVYDKRTQKRLADGLQYKIMQVNGVKIGFFSLAEKQWIDTLYPFYKEFCEYVDFIQFATYIVKELRQTHKCDMIIALTHMMKYNDIKLAEEVDGIDLILGGHDHLIVHEKVKNSVLVKSGTNFRNFSIIQVSKKQNCQNKPQGSEDKESLSNSKWNFRIKLKQVNHTLQKIEPNPQLDAYITQIYSSFEQKQQKIACYTKKPIDLRFQTIRRQQTAFLQFIASFYRHFTGAECAFMNSGNFRMDCQIKEGPITFGVMTKLILDQVVMKRIPGKQIVQGLQNSVSMYPNMAGRYSALSGLSFQWDCEKQPYQRVIKQSIRLNGQVIDQQKEYKVAMHSFMGLGGDGYACFKPYPMDQNSAGIDNIHIVHELLTLNEDLMESYTPKYPGRFNIIEIEGHKYLELDLPEPKNVKMIGSKH